MSILIGKITNMKNIVRTLIVLLVVAFPVKSYSQIKMGVKTGLSMSQPSFDVKNLKSKSYTGFFVGPVLECTIPIIGIGADAAILYTHRGGDFTIKNASEDLKKHVGQNGIAIPINLKYNIGFSSLAGIYFSAGPDFFFNFSSDKELDDYKIINKKSNVGVNLGAGVNLLRRFQVGLNYYIPFSKTFEVEQFKNVGDVKSEIKGDHVKLWQISATYFF